MFDTIRQENRLLYEYVRGSTLYNLNTKDSDIDTSGIYVAKDEEVLGFLDYKPQVSDSKHDNTWFEVGEFARLIIKSNPTMLESLFIPENKIISKVSPLIMPFLENREQFISKQCFWPFYGYAVSQIEKAHGLNKKIYQERIGEDNVRKSPYEFIYTFHKQGSTKLKDWLSNHGLKQEYCGLNRIPNMHNMYGLYYDWIMHIICENYIKDDIWCGEEKFTNTMLSYFKSNYKKSFSVRDIIEGIKENTLKPYGYKGIIGDFSTSNDLSLSSIDDKNDMPLIHISYNKDGYSAHCRRFKELQVWKKERNPKRYESNLDKSYDSKNIMHCFRMMHMAKEIAEGQGINLERTWDREFLLDVRNHKFEYDEIYEKLEEEKAELKEAMAKSDIREKIDVNFVNDLLIDFRRSQLGLK